MKIRDIKNCRDDALARKPMIAQKGIIALFCAFMTMVIASLIAFCPTAAYAKDKDKPIQITLSAAGDCTLGVDSRYNRAFDSQYSRHGSSYFLRNVRGVFSKDDLTIVNFEGTLTNARTRASKTFTFKGPSRYANILKKGSVEVVTLANNHSKDFLSKGFRDTKRTLIKTGIPYCYKSKIAYKKVKGVKVAFLGFNELDGVTKKQVKTGIERAKSKGASVIVASFHWGIEKSYRPTANQKNLGRYAIRCGASLVLGHHPHVLQGIEKYKGRYIVYSLGNFCFGGNTNPNDKDTMIFQQTFSVKDGKLLKKGDARVIPCSISGKTYTNTFQPRVLKGSDRKRVMKKLKVLSRPMHLAIKNDGSLK